MSSNNSPVGSESRLRVVVTTRSFGSGDADPLGLLEGSGLEVVRATPAHDPPMLEEPLSTAVAWIAGTSPIGEDLLSLAPHLRLIARYGIGVDSVDLEAASRRGVLVTNTPGANVEAVADQAVGLMIASLRGFAEGDRLVRAREHASLRGRELGPLTAGLVGFGRVGRAVAHRLASGFGTRILVYDPFVRSDAVREAGYEATECVEALASASDVVSLHLPGGTEPLVNEPFLREMKPGGVLVNTARGDLVEEAAVAAALGSGRLSAAAFDVLATEPASDSPLLTAPNVLFTPHTAAQTVEAIDRMGMGAAEEVVRLLGGESVRNSVTAE